MKKSKTTQDAHSPASIAQVNGLAEAGARMVPELEIVTFSPAAAERTISTSS